MRENKSVLTGVHHIRLHDLSHTHATLMLEAGVHPKIVQERLGHSTIATTIDTYSHVLPGLQEAAARAFDEQVKTNGGKMTEVRYAPEGIRTPDPRFRRPMLLSAELRALFSNYGLWWMKCYLDSFFRSMGCGG